MLHYVHPDGCARGNHTGGTAKSEQRKYSRIPILWQERQTKTEWSVPMRGKRGYPAHINLLHCWQENKRHAALTTLPICCILDSVQSWRDPRNAYFTAETHVSYPYTGFSIAQGGIIHRPILLVASAPNDARE